LILHNNYFSFIFRTKIKVTFVARFDPLSISFVTPPSKKKENEKEKEKNSNSGKILLNTTTAGNISKDLNRMA
jgi:hypothetical protein